MAEATGSVAADAMTTAVDALGLRGRCASSKQAAVPMAKKAAAPPAVIGALEICLIATVGLFQSVHAHRGQEFPLTA
jgi:hypothetical protein